MTVRSFGAAMTHLGEVAPAAPAVTCDGETVTRGELESRANRRARTFTERGIGVGDRVLLGLPNGIALIENALALWKVGATPVLLPAGMPVTEATQLAELAQPVAVIGTTLPPSSVSRHFAADWQPAAATSDAPPSDDVVPPSWKAPCSGGSTGTPKIIFESAPGVIDSDESPGFGLRPGGVQLISAPLHHNAPFGFAARGLLTGQHLVLMSKFDAGHWLDLVREHEVQWTMVVPTMMRRIQRHVTADPNGVDVSSLERVWHMAAPCADDLKRWWLDWIEPDVLWELYGSTEQIAATVISGSEWLAHPGSVGRPLFGEITVFDGAGAAVAPDTVGEIYLRPPDGMATFHYVGAEEQRRPDGWTTVGDLGRLDADGYLYIADRRVDLILSGGANVYPAEVEAALETHPGVLEAVVVGLPDDDLGQRVHALVRADPDLAAHELLAHTEQRLARYKVPRSIEFTSEPLRDEAGKVRRTALRDRAVSAGTA